MKRTTKILILLVLALAATAAHAGPAIIPPVRVRIVCTVPTPWDAQSCWVEFGDPVTGQSVEVASQTDAEELVAILLANGGRRYTLDTRQPIKSKPLPANASPR